MNARIVYLGCMATFGLVSLAVAVPGVLSGPGLAEWILLASGFGILGITGWAALRLRDGSLPEAAVPDEFGRHVYVILAATVLYVVGAAWKLLV